MWAGTRRASQRWHHSLWDVLCFAIGLIGFLDALRAEALYYVPSAVAVATYCWPKRQGRSVLRFTGLALGLGGFAVLAALTLGQFYVLS